MSYRLERVPDFPIIIFYQNDDYRVEVSLNQLIDDYVAEVKRFDKPGYGIIVQRGNYTVNELIDSAATMRKKKHLLRSNPNYRGTILVNPSDLDKLPFKNLSGDNFGNLSFEIFDTLDEALAYAKINCQS